MKIFRSKFIFSILILLVVFGLAYYYKEDIGHFARPILNQLQPCQSPITYSIANFDARFGLTQKELLADIKRAEKIWELAINKDLFEYSPTGDLKISLIYDYRQKATDDLRKIGVVINNDKDTYDTLKAKYDVLIISYKKQKTQLEDLIANYTIDNDAYEKEVNRWSKRGGAPKPEYDGLERKRIDLNNQVAVINQNQDYINSLVDTINSMETVLNKLVGALNLHVSTYNEVGASTGKEFSAGEYTRDANGTAIHIYQFNNTDQLVRVMAHEFGHALEIDHLDNPKAVMYYLNEEGVNENLIADDVNALKKVCRIDQ